MSSSIIVPKDLIRVGFQAEKTRADWALSVCTYAKPKVGKTHWALETTPAPVAVISLDSGTKDIVDKLRRGGRDIYPIYIPMPDSKDKDTFKPVWHKVEKAIQGCIASKSIRTVVIDTATELYELLRLYAFGKLSKVMPHQYTEVNQVMRELVKGACDREDLNSIWIHKTKKEYKTNKDGKDTWTGRMERAGFGDIPYITDVTLENVYDIKSNTFGIRVLENRHNHELVGTEFWGDESSFQWFAMQSLPDVDLKYWE